MNRRTSISEVFDTYTRIEVVAAGLSTNTVEGYRNTRRLVVGFFGDVPIENLDAESILRFREHLLSWQKPDTVRSHICQIRSILRWCRRKKMEVMDIEDIRVPKREKRIIVYLTEPEVAEFIKVVGQRRRGYSNKNRERNVAIVELLYSTGLRVGELCRLDRNSIRNRQFTVVGKSKHPRICFITKHVEKSIEKYLSTRYDNNPALFISNQTKQRVTRGNIQRVFRFACERSDFVGITPHTMRHSFATKLLERRVDLRYVGDLMGHQSLDTTKHYTHYSNPKLRSIYDAAHE